MTAIRSTPDIDGDGKLYGRGSFDMKGGVAAMMVAAARAKAEGLRGDILVACVADEEYASFGTEEVARHFQRRRGDRHRAQPSRAHHRAQGLRLVRRDRRGPRRAWLAARSRHRRHRQGRQVPGGARSLRPAPARQSDACDPEIGLGARLDDRRRRRVVELSGALPHLAGAPHHSRRDAALVQAELEAIIDAIADGRCGFPAPSSSSA